MTSLPPIIDIRDDLTRAREATDADVDEEFRTIRDRLDAFADRDAANRTGIVDEIDNQLLRVEARLDGEAARSIAAARNRLRIYRQTRDQADDELSVVESHLRRPGESDGDLTVEDVHGQDVTVAATVANSGATRSVAPVATFYDADMTDLESLSGPPTEVPEGDQRTVDIEGTVPDEAAYYAVSVAEESGRARDSETSI